MELLLDKPMFFWELQNMGHFAEKISSLEEVRGLHTVMSWAG